MPLKKIEQLFGPIIQSSSDVVVITTADLVSPGGPEIVFVNPAFTWLTGYSAEEAIGTSPRMLQGPDTNRQTCAEIRAALLAHRQIDAEILNYHKNGHSYWLDLNINPLRDDSGRVTHFAAIQHDITHQKAVEAQLQSLSMTDDLTRMPNRRAFLEAFDTEVLRATRYVSPFCLLVIDLDFFKLINDRHGHAGGDAVLVHFSKICRELLRGVDIAARVGGEEFAILLPETSRAGALQVSERIRNAVKAQPTIFHGDEINTTISIGVTDYQAPESAASQIMMRADEALYNAKQNGRDQVCATWEITDSETVTTETLTSEFVTPSTSRQAAR